MKLHGNAARSLNQRRRLAKRVVEEDWSLTSAAHHFAFAASSTRSGRPGRQIPGRVDP